MELEIKYLDSKGRGIGYTIKSIFIFNALPGEIVDFKIVKEKSKYIVGEVEKIIKRSNDRVESVCPYFGICGGCDTMHMSYEYENWWKEKKYRDSFMSLLNEECVKDILFDNELYYRNKATFKVDKNIGFYKKESHKIVPISKCFLLNPKINEIYDFISNNINLDGILEVTIRVGNESLVWFKTTKNIDTDKLEDIVDSVVVNDKVVFGKGYISLNLNDLKYHVSAPSFFQVNSKLTLKMYELIKSYISDSDSVLDLYCGTGSIGIFVSSKAKKVFGVEINESAIKDAYENRKINNLNNIDFECLNTSYFDKSLKDFSVVIIDPPRSGLDKKTISYLLKEEVAKIIYVSCDMMTLIRDLDILKQKYEIKEATPINLFPRTYHTECVCLLELK